MFLLFLITLFAAGSRQYLLKDLSCNTNEIKDSNVIIHSCFNSTYIPNSESVQIECIPGYYLNTSSVVTCQSGVWSDVHQCVPGCPPPGKRNNARLNWIKQRYDVGEEVIYTCDDGYFSWKDYRFNQFNLICQHDSTWSDKTADCNAQHQFSILIINAKTLSTISAELVCDLNVDNVTWIRNGNEVETSGELRLTPNQNLIVNIKNCNTCGVYVCIGKVNNRLQIGQKIYKVIMNDIPCFSPIKQRWPIPVKFKENQNVLLLCPHHCKDNFIRWYKDGEEIFNSKHQNIIPDTGLFLTNITLYTEGDFTCQLMYKRKQHNSMVNITYTLTVLPSSESICGRKRFYGGKHSWYQPWLALFYHSDTNGIPFCYGSLLNSKWIITSAYCLEHFEKRKTFMDDVIVELGQVGEKEKYTVVAIEIHPQYKLRGTANDLGLVQIRILYATDKNQFDDIFPACISPEDIGSIHNCERVVNLNGTVAGWGSWLGNKNRKIVDAEKMSVVPKEICRNSTKIGFAEDKFCAKFNGKEEDFVGDSGSPFLVRYHERRYLLGIYTWGQRDTGAGSYDYYTSIYYHYDWIISIINK